MGATAVSLAQGEQPGVDYPYFPVPFTAVKADGGFWWPRIPTTAK